MSLIEHFIVVSAFDEKKKTGLYLEEFPTSNTNIQQLVFRSFIYDSLSAPNSTPFPVNIEKVKI